MFFFLFFSFWLWWLVGYARESACSRGENIFFWLDGVWLVFYPSGMDGWKMQLMTLLGSGNADCRVRLVCRFVDQNKGGHYSITPYVFASLLPMRSKTRRQGVAIVNQRPY
jgi:hypothetical protein